MAQEVQRALETDGLAAITWYSGRVPFGESGVAGGVALAGALLHSEPEAGPILTLASARGGVNAATLIER